MAEEKEVEKLDETLKDYKSQIIVSPKGTLTWDKELIFIGRTQKGYEVDFDANQQWGCSPTETFLLSVAGCIGIDCVVFLRKMKAELESFKVEITGHRMPNPPQYYTSFEIMIHIKGKNITDKKVQRAISLSREKYCSVYHSLRKDIKMQIDYTIT